MVDDPTNVSIYDDDLYHVELSIDFAMLGRG